MKANREYRLLHRRGGRAPSRLAGPERFDQIEVVEIAMGETVLLWDLPSRDAPATLRELRADMAQLDGAAFIARWRER
ncbi:MAG: hypothetical protein QOG68_863 [Solirubrobacteraceae bacterium]|jgi:hypothetical protein|nr:hypothetical protein [Solirubrobacteraceae bacterium]